MADNEQSPEKLIKPPYKEKKCEREFRKLLETTNLKVGSTDNESPIDKSQEAFYTEKKCEREFRKLLETTKLNTSNKEIDGSTEKFHESHIEGKCDSEFQKLLKTDDSETDNVKYYNNENAVPEKKRKGYKLNEPDLNDDSSSNSSITSFSHFQKCKAMCSGESSGSLKTGSNMIVSTETLSSRASLADLQALYDCLEQDNSLETKCECVISLTVLCSDTDLSAELVCSALGALNLMQNSQKSDALAFCHSLLLFTLTRQNLNSEQIIYLEDQVVKLADSVIRYEKGFGNILVLRMILQRGGHYLKAYKLCQKLFAEKNLDIDAIDVLTLCCSSIKNLSTCAVGKTYRYKDRTLKFILGMTGKATQEIVAENLLGADDGYTFVSAPSHMVNQCLSSIEHMLSLDRDSPCNTLDHEDFSLLHCLTRLLGWCMSYLFQKDQSGNNFLNTQHSSLSSFHISTLVSILKILAMLSFPPSQHYDSFTNIKGLMEKIMICILKVYFQSEEKRFDVLVLALELMINFFLKNKRYFVLLCLKKFQINSCEQILTIEGLLKILGNSLEKINDIKQKPLTVEKEDDDDDSGSGQPPDNLHLVSDAAEEDFELSTIVSFTSILLVLFMDSKQSFENFIRERLSQEKSSEAIIVSKKVLQFASITGGMPVTGILLLRHAIRKLSRLYTAQPSHDVPTIAL